MGYHIYLLKRLKNSFVYLIILMRKKFIDLNCSNFYQSVWFFIGWKEIWLKKKDNAHLKCSQLVGIILAIKPWTLYPSNILDKLGTKPNWNPRLNINWYIQIKCITQNINFVCVCVCVCVCVYMYIYIYIYIYAHTPTSIWLWVSLMGEILDEL